MVVAWIVGWQLIEKCATATSSCCLGGYGYAQLLRRRTDNEGGGVEDQTAHPICSFSAHTLLLG